MSEVEAELPPADLAANVGAPPQSAAPDQEQAEAMAEVAAMGNGNNNDNTAEQAMMGAAQEGAPEIQDESGELVQQRFVQFLGAFHQEIADHPDAQEGSNLFYPYVEQANQMAKKLLRKDEEQLEEEEEEDDDSPTSSFSNTLFVDFSHLMAEDVELAEAIQCDYVRFEPFLRKAVQTFFVEQHPTAEPPLFFLAVYNIPTVLTLRNLRTDRIGHLSAVAGTVTRTSEVRPELLVASFRCNKCGLLAEGIRQQYHYTRPTLCRNPRCKNTSPLHFTLEASSSEFVDWQKLRVQENSDEIPPGSMPRSLDLILRNEMVEMAKAGDKCVFTGSLVVLPDGSALARAGEAPRALSNQSDTGGGVRGLAALGVKELTYRTCFVVSAVIPATDSPQSSAAGGTLAPQQQPAWQHAQMDSSAEPTTEQVAMELTTEQREEIRQMCSTPNLYEQLAKSIVPSTFGHLEIKKGILLMLLGGVHKTTSDGIKLRGDVNVCIVGDPSTAKSQFLKYVHAFLPSRSVYTSGKASSAAGLTAAVQRDGDTGEYCIEAGALMLADNGICCIDEFDKMDPNDQVAIHEAMEQQTISITKAGIQATLNARASVLAAANPIYGRYDRSKTLRANVALSAPILSRFDLFFVVLDECNPDSDRHVAQHILNVHRCSEQTVQAPFTQEQMQRYIRFCRTIHPKMTEDAQRVLVDCYRRLRQGDSLGRSRTAYRITVRQLESLIRLSEALARLHCDQDIQPDYVRKAFRLLKISIIQVETSDVAVDEEDDDDDDNSPGDDPGHGGDGEAMDESPGEQDNEETQAGAADNLETQPPVHPGEFGSEQPALEVQPGKKKKKKKTKISFEEYEAMANMIATHMRSLESDDDGGSTRYLKWKEIIEWYLEQMEQDLGDSIERLEETRKKLTLVLRRLLNVDKILVVVGEAPKSKKEELETMLAVHPNYSAS